MVSAKVKFIISLEDTATFLKSSTESFHSEEINKRVDTGVDINERK